MDLYQAATLGDTDAIRFAAEQGHDVNTPNIDGITPLWPAVQHGPSDACVPLITRGANIEAQSFSILELAVQQGHADIVALLRPHCKAEKEHRSLGSAISLGFHEIADLLIGTGELEYEDSHTNGADLIVREGFLERDCAAFQQWEIFIFGRRGKQLNLNHVFFDYALLLSAKADRNKGLQLMKLLLQEPNCMADVNCKIKINQRFETPLTAAAEAGNLEILAALIDHPNTNLTICGKYNWPAFLHLLANLQSISTEKGQVIAQRLYDETPLDLFVLDSGKIGLGTGLELAVMNALQFGDDTLVKRVIELVKGAAGNAILPLLIRANELSGLKWILNCDIVHAHKPPPILWVSLCDYFISHPHSDALKLFTQVAEYLVDNAIWSRIILKCLYARNFSLVRQVFCHLRKVAEVTEETIVRLSEESADQSMLEEWANHGLANATLWYFTHHRISRDPAFENLLSCPSIEPNGSDPHEGSLERSERIKAPLPSFSNLPSQGQDVPFRAPL